MYYKIIELKKGLWKFLFHGINKSKIITRGMWYDADVKWVKDGSSYPYESGFHIFDDLKTARKYLKIFRDDSKTRIIVGVECEDVRSKGPRTKVLLAKRIKFK